MSENQFTEPSVPRMPAEGVYGVPPAPYASWLLRVAAVLIEMALLLALTVIVFLPLNALQQPRLTQLGGVLVLAVFLYWQFQNGSCGQSPGKALLGLRVVSSRTGEPIGGLLGLVRYGVAVVLSIFTCGCMSTIDYLFPLWDRQAQTLHDKAVGSVVLADQPRRRVSQLLSP